MLDVAKMFKEIENIIVEVVGLPISDQRKQVLDSLAVYVQDKVTAGEDVNINFICTHNSRRSHLAQIWAQVAAGYYHIPKVYCYSGGTEATALYTKVADTLKDAGFEIDKLADMENPIFMIKYSDSSMPIIGFSKTYDHPFNPATSFAAVMTCSQADGGCPLIAGAEKRIPITFEDPKVSDGTPEQPAVYRERSFQIASEMCYVFSQIKQ